MITIKPKPYKKLDKKTGKWVKIETDFVELRNLNKKQTIFSFTAKNAKI
jgi:hypothetical protein